MADPELSPSEPADLSSVTASGGKTPQGECCTVCLGENLSSQRM